MNNPHSDLLPELELEPFLVRYGDGRRRRNMEPLYREMLELAHKVAEAREVHAEFGLSDLPELAEWLTSRAVGVVLVVCTLGPAIDVLEQRLFPEDPHKAVVLNEIGSEQVTRLTRAVHQMIRTEVAPRDLKAGPAYRPGVGQWPLELQTVVFDRLPAHEVGVTLDEYLTMTPLKSNSLIVPLLTKK